MRNVEYDKARVVKYLVWTFAAAYIIQICAARIWNSGNMMIGSLVIAAMMFVPAAGVLLSGAKLSDIGWRPQIRKNIKIIMIAWLSPVILTAIGAALYFMIFPGHFDLSGEYITASAGADVLAQMEDQGISYPVYILVSLISSITYAPLINTFVALGEEIGWRGFLYPQLKMRFGRRKGWLIGGFIWGAWHWPLIWLIGYEYGAAAGNPAGYAGFPVSGMLIFCIITIGLGILHDRLYEKSGSIWLPSLFHGAVNAVGMLPLSICMINTGSARLLGPAPMGIIAGLPFLAVAAVLMLRKDKQQNAG